MEVSRRFEAVNEHGDALNQTFRCQQVQQVRFLEELH